MAADFSKINGVVVCGGDTFVNEVRVAMLVPPDPCQVLSGLLQRFSKMPCPLGVVGTGSMNALAGQLDEGQSPNRTRYGCSAQRNCYHCSFCCCNLCCCLCIIGALLSNPSRARTPHLTSSMAMQATLAIIKGDTRHIDVLELLGQGGPRYGMCVGWGLPAAAAAQRARNGTFTSTPALLAKTPV